MDRRLTDFDCEVAASISLLTSIVTHLLPQTATSLVRKNELDSLRLRLQLIEDALQVEAKLREQELYEQAKSFLDLEEAKWLDDGGNLHGQD